MKTIALILSALVNLGVTLALQQSSGDLLSDYVLPDGTAVTLDVVSLDKPNAVNASGSFLSEQSAIVLYSPSVTERSVVKVDPNQKRWMGFRPSKLLDSVLGQLLDIRFTTSNRGWLASTKGVWQSEDGGHVWRFLVRGGLLPVFADENHGWLPARILSSDASTGSENFITTDGGRKWHRCGPSTQPIHGIPTGRASFIDANNGWALQYEELNPGHRDSVVYTSDGGCTWELKWTPRRPGNSLNSIYFQTMRNGWIGGNGDVLKTTDGGAHWSSISEMRGVRIVSLYFVNEINGWFLAENFGEARGGIYHTCDGGQSWDLLPRHANVDNKTSCDENIPKNWNAGKLHQLLTGTGPH